MRPHEVERALGVSPATVRRWTAAGILPPPQYVNGVRDWPPEVVEDVRAKLTKAPRREFPAAELGRRIRDDMKELRAAAGEALVHAGLSAVVEVMKRRHGWNRLAEVPPSERRRLTHELHRMSQVYRGGLQ